MKMWEKTMEILNKCKIQQFYYLQGKPIACDEPGTPIYNGM